ncbi:MAG TPA: type VI secretion system lipoprotein TssJ [Nitrospiria bacterium]|nr:type VI secretion system lipoprotein TssJ [Nitrospiria bacterium]
MLAFLLAAFLGGCGKREIELSLAGTKSLNLDDSGAPLPVVLRVYLLKKKEKMEGADFISLWKNDKDLLEGDILDRQEFTLFPDTKKVLKLTPHKEAEFLAVMALFRKPKGNHWREIIPLKGKKVRSVEIEVEERTIKINKVG